MRYLHVNLKENLGKLFRLMLGGGGWGGGGNHPTLPLQSCLHPRKES